MMSPCSPRGRAQLPELGGLLDGLLRNSAGTGGRGVCPADGRSAHQCPRCLLPAPHDPKSCTAVPHDLSKKGKGKGRGKDGQGKGKGAQH